MLSQTLKWLNPVKMLCRRQYISLGCFNNTPIRYHFLEHEVSVLRSEHDVQFALNSKPRCTNVLNRDKVSTNKLRHRCEPSM